jgi:hypothetical protein
MHCVAPLLAVADDWVSPANSPGDSDTEKLQYALDNYQRVLLDRDYNVTSVAIHRVGQRVDFRGYGLNGVDQNRDNEACLYIRGRELDLRDVRVNANYCYRAAIRWHSVESDRPAQYNKVFGMHVTHARVGILYGAFADPVDSPQSENAIFGLTFRCVQVCIRCNQPNGYLYIANSVLDCNPFEWRRDRPGDFDDASARAVLIERGHIEVANSEILKTSTQKGHMTEVSDAGSLKLANCHYESGGAAFLLRGGLWASNLSGHVNSDSTPVFDIPADAGRGVAMLSNCHLRRMRVVSRYSGMALIRSAPQVQYRVSLSNCLLDGWQPHRLASGGVTSSARQVLFRFVREGTDTQEEFVD